MFGNFDIQETVGQGGMGVVYRARDITLNRDVAIKVLKDELRENPKVVARFRREAEAIASLDHPRIVQVFSVGAVGNIPYFAMEYIEGKPLNRVLRRHKVLQWKPALRVARDVAEALAAAHEAGIIHRDIKPGNILIDRNGNAFVTDFGIAKVLTAETQLTVDGSKLGTPQYMSPERVQNHEITVESDIYSLGVVLFQMLTGKLPYDAHDPIELIRMIVVDPPKRVREYNEDLSEDIERLVAYMLEKKNQDRPRSAGQVVDLINRLLDGKPLFDSDSGVDDAYEELREEVSTPYSDSTMDLDRKRPSRWAGIAARWKTWPAWLRTTLVVGPTVAIALAAGFAVSSARRGDAVPAVVQAFSLNPNAWYHQADLVRFAGDPASGVTMQFLLDGYQIADFRFAQDGAPLVTLQNGGQRVAAEIVPAETRATLLAPVGDWPATDSAALYSRDSASAIIARQVSDGELELHQASLAASGEAMLSGRLADRVQVWAASPDSDRILTGRQEGRGGRSLQEWALTGGDPEPETLFTSQQDLRGIQYSANGTGIVFQEQLADGFETHIFLRDAGRRRLTLGAAALASGALNESCDKLIVLESAESGSTRAAVIDAVTGARIAELGEAVDAAWTSNDTVALLATDRSGELQVWRASLGAMPSRQQRSFVDGGVAPRLAVRMSDGSVLVARAKADYPALELIGP